jgi:predicted small secreted protein
MRTVAIIMATSLALAGCNTVRGLGQDVQQIGGKVGETAETVGPKIGETAGKVGQAIGRGVERVGKGMQDAATSPREDVDRPRRN